MRPSLDLSNRSTKLHKSLSATYICYAAKNSRNYMGIKCLNNEMIFWNLHLPCLRSRLYWCLGSQKRTKSTDFSSYQPSSIQPAFRCADVLPIGGDTSPWSMARRASKCCGRFEVLSWPEVMRESYPLAGKPHRTRYTSKVCPNPYRISLAALWFPRVPGWAVNVEGHGRCPRLKWHLGRVGPIFWMRQSSWSHIWDSSGLFTSQDLFQVLKVSSETRLICGKLVFRVLMLQRKFLVYNYHLVSLFCCWN